MLSITGLATNSALNAVENKIPDVSNLVRETDYDTKTSDIESECFTTFDYDKFTNEIINNEIKEKKLV